MFSAGLWVSEAECGVYGVAEVVGDASVFEFGDYVDGAGCVVGCNGGAAGEGFDHDEAEGVGSAGEDEDFGLLVGVY